MNDKERSQLPVHKVTVNTLENKGSICVEGQINAGNLQIVNKLRTPWELFLASAAVTAGAIFMISLTSIATKATKFIAGLF